MTKANKKTAFLSLRCAMPCTLLAGMVATEAEAQTSWRPVMKNMPPRPNVVIIIADDLGFGDVSAYGQTTISTPNIDSLARGGVCFDNGYATSATSTPSRYGMLTGYYPWRNKDAHILDGNDPLIINPESMTFPRMMQQAGYRTAAVGKWHLGMGRGEVDWNKEVVPGAREVGFDFSCIAAATNDRVPTVFVENDRVLNLDPDDPIFVSYKENFPGEPTALSNPEMLRMRWSHGHNNSIINGIPRIGFMKGGERARWIDEDLADFYSAKAKQFITECATASKRTPFFLYYGLHQPHVPRTPHQRFVGASGMGPRGDAIVEADWCVGEIIAHLDSLNLLENTLVIFTSDNGPVLDDGYEDQAAELLGDHSPTAGLRGGKYSLFDGGTHVPLFVYWKGRIAPHRTDALLCQVDFMASVAQLANIVPPAGLDSRPLLPLMLGESDEGREELVVEAQGRLALRQGRYILIPAYKGKERNSTGNELGNLPATALFDLVADPFQTNDIASDHPDLVEQMSQRLALLSGKR